MATTTTTPNMGLILPVPGQDPGPDWAQNQYASGFIIDSHSHVAGQGVQITPAAININADLPFNSNNATAVKTVRFTAQSASLAGSSPNLGCIYVAGNELYYNDLAGNVVKLTLTGSVNATSSGISSGTATASFSGGVLVVNSNTNTPANIQVGSVLIGNNVANSKFATLQVVNSLASNYSLTLPLTPGSTSLVSLDSSGNFGTTMTTALADSVGTAMDSTGSNSIANTRTRTTGTTVAAGGVALSSSSGVFTTTNTGFTPVTNLSVTITTTGRPVELKIQSDGSGNQGFVFGANSVGSTAAMVGGFFNGVTSISNQNVTMQGSGANVQIIVPPSSFNHTDLSVIGTPGTYTYTFQIALVTGNNCGVEYAKLVAYEL